MMISPEDLHAVLVESLLYIASSEKAREYQRNAPIADVPAELFCQWDDEYHPEDPVLPEAFTENELKALASFHRQFEKVADATPDILPPLEEFFTLPEFQSLQRRAVQTLAALGVHAQQVASVNAKTAAQFKRS
jgi:hypothetical protein